jgi:putative addiction module component (TIGR02574 family)
MAAELNQVFHDALELSDSERATLVGLLIESLEAGEADADVEAAWAAEAERRWQEIESGQVKTIPWEEVRANLLRENDEN